MEGFTLPLSAKRLQHQFTNYLGRPESACISKERLGPEVSPSSMQKELHAHNLG